ncbi:TSUP family transporter [Pelomonas cellulosilytica]|uniref:Probable membrane transporter protein n=1 Tax=Pelomonas cellulosilytica TaxID=2906762 RepID=A0ABS8XRU3_9BURK|nr:TSUP family transporter [Pelomonas sp. P8]MCE4555424.1 TSUP family transporter [Pelomonas sp. P8]
MPPFFEFSCLVQPHVALALALIYTTASVFSGLSGFGFSAIGCLSLLVLPPPLAVALLMGLSLLTQLASFGSLRRELRQHLGPWRRRDGVLPYLAGGTVGLPVGLHILGAAGAPALTTGLGLLLIAYAGWSLARPAARPPMAGEPSLLRPFLVGAAGGVVGGFSAFPGSAVVVWHSLRGTGKQQGRALTQPYILWMQLVGLALLAATQPQLFGHPFQMVFVAAAPLTLLGNLLGVAIYRRTGDVGYRQLTLLALGLAGVGLLLKVALA